MRTVSIGALGAVAALVVALGGCAVHASPPVGYVEVTSGPVDVGGYPSTYYDGRNVYFVNDRWVYYDGGRWLYYVNEPPSLYRYRHYYVRPAPPAYSYPRYAPRRQAPPRAAPPSYRTPSQRPPYRTPARPRVAPPASAPPASRVR